MTGVQLCVGRSCGRRPEPTRRDLVGPPKRARPDGDLQRKLDAFHGDESWRLVAAALEGARALMGTQWTGPVRAAGLDGLSERRSVLLYRGKIHGDSRRFKVTSPQPRNVTEGGLCAHGFRSGPTRGSASGFFRRLGERCPRRLVTEATERTFLVAEVVRTTQVFAAVRFSDSMNSAARDPIASRQSDDDRISIS
jgi:hypothetical protein